VLHSFSHTLTAEGKIDLSVALSFSALFSHAWRNKRSFHLTFGFGPLFVSKAGSKACDQFRGCATATVYACLRKRLIIVDTWTSC